MWSGRLWCSWFCQNSQIEPLSCQMDSMASTTTVQLSSYFDSFFLIIPAISNLILWFPIKLCFVVLLFCFQGILDNVYIEPNNRYVQYEFAIFPVWFFSTIWQVSLNTSLTRYLDANSNFVKLFLGNVPMPPLKAPKLKVFFVFRGYKIRVLVRL